VALERNQLNYWTVTNELTTHCLLHLNSLLCSSERFIPLKKRNEIVAKFIAARVKQPRYKLVKKDIQNLLAFYKKGKDIVEQIEAIHQQCRLQKRNRTDADRLYLWLNYCHQVHDIESKLFEPGDALEMTVLYTTKELINNRFDDKNNNVKAILFWSTDPLSEDVIQQLPVCQFRIVNTKKSNNTYFYKLLAIESAYDE